MSALQTPTRPAAAAAAAAASAAAAAAAGAATPSTPSTPASRRGGGGGAGAGSSSNSSNNMASAMDTGDTLKTHYSDIQLLYDTLKNASARSKRVTPENLGAMLVKHHDELLNTVGSYMPPNNASRVQVETGRVYPDWFKHWHTFALEFSTIVQLDERQACDVLATYMRLRHAKRALAPAPQGNVALKTAAENIAAATRRDGELTHESLVRFYFQERQALLRCALRVLFSAIDEQDPYHEVAERSLRKLIADGWRGAIMNQYQQIRKRTLPRLPDDLVGIVPESFLADSYALEQALLLNILFVHFFHQPARGIPAKIVLQFLRLFRESNFGQRQPLYTHLSRKGRAIVDWVGQICVMLTINLFHLDDVTPESMDASDALRMGEHVESTRARRLAVFNAHPLANPKTMKELLLVFVDLDRLPPTRGRLPLHGTVLLAFSVFYAHVTEFWNELRDAGLDYDGSPLSEEMKDRYMQERRRPGARLLIEEQYDENLVAMFGAARNLRAFHTLVAILASLHADHNPLQRLGMSNMATPYKSVSNELLKALVTSRVFRFFAHAPDDFAVLFPLFVLGHKDNTELCTQFWEHDSKPGKPLQCLLDHARLRFPWQASPLLHLLTSLGGSTFPLHRRGRMNASHSELEVDSIEKADDVYCSQAVSVQLGKMSIYTVPEASEGLASRLRVLIPGAREAVDDDDVDSQTVYQLAEAWLSPDKFVLPAGTRCTTSHVVGCPIRLVHFHTEWSAWPVLIYRLHNAVNEAARGASSGAWWWDSIASIVELMDRVFAAKPSHLSVVQERTDSASTNGSFPSVAGVNITGVLLRLLGHIAKYLETCGDSASAADSRHGVDLGAGDDLRGDSGAGGNATEEDAVVGALFNMNSIDAVVGSVSGIDTLSQERLLAFHRDRREARLQQLAERFRGRGRGRSHTWGRRLDRKAQMNRTEEFAAAEIALKAELDQIEAEELAVCSSAFFNADLLIHPHVDPHNGGNGAAGAAGAAAAAGHAQPSNDAAANATSSGESVSNALVLRVLEATIGILVTSAQADVANFAEILVKEYQVGNEVRPEGSAGRRAHDSMVNGMGHLGMNSSDRSSGAQTHLPTPSSGSDGTVSLLGVFRILMTHLEFSQGRYPASLGLLQILTVLEPHHRQCAVVMQHRQAQLNKFRMQRRAGQPFARQARRQRVSASHDVDQEALDASREEQQLISALARARHIVYNLDLQPFFHYVCADIFVGFSSWHFRDRLEQWTLAATMLRLLQNALTSTVPAATIFMPSSAEPQSGFMGDASLGAGHGNGGLGSEGHGSDMQPDLDDPNASSVSSALKRFLIEVFIHEVAMQQALFHILLVGRPRLAALLKGRMHSGHKALQELQALQEAIQLGLAITGQVLSIQRAWDERLIRRAWHAQLLRHNRNVPSAGGPDSRFGAVGVAATASRAHGASRAGKYRRGGSRYRESDWSDANDWLEDDPSRQRSSRNNRRQRPGPEDSGVSLAGANAAAAAAAAVAAAFNDEDLDLMMDSSVAFALRGSAGAAFRAARAAAAASIGAVRGIRKAAQAAASGVLFGSSQASELDPNADLLSLGTGGLRVSVTFPPSFRQALLDYTPAQGTGVRLADGRAQNLVHCLVGLAALNSEGLEVLQTSPAGQVSDIQRLSIQIVGFLCRPPVRSISRGQSAPPSLTSYMEPAVAGYRRVLLRLLSRESSPSSTKAAIFQLLIACFEHQPGLTERLLKISPAGSTPNTTPLKSPIGSSTSARARDEVQLEPFGEESMLRYVREVLESTREYFAKNPVVLAHIMQIVHSLLVASPGFSNLAIQFKKQFPNFWRHIIYCLREPVEDISFPVPSVSEGVKRGAQGSLEEQLQKEDTKRLQNHRARLSVRTWALLIIVHSDGFDLGPNQMDQKLRQELTDALRGGDQMRWAEQFVCGFQEDGHAMQQRALELGINMGAFRSSVYATAFGSDSCQDGIDIINPVYDVSLIRRSLLLEDENSPVSMFHDMLNAGSSMQDEDAKDASEQTPPSGRKRRSSRLNAGSSDSLSLRRKDILGFLSQVRTTQNGWVLADCQLGLLRAWKLFLEVSLFQQPELVGMMPLPPPGPKPPPLVWPFIDRITTWLAETCAGPASSFQSGRVPSARARAWKLRRPFFLVFALQEATSLLFLTLGQFINCDVLDAPSFLLIKAMVEAHRAEESENGQVVEKSDARRASTMAFKLLGRLIAAQQACSLAFLPAPSMRRRNANVVSTSKSMRLLTFAGDPKSSPQNAPKINRPASLAVSDDGKVPEWDNILFDSDMKMMQRKYEDEDDMKDEFSLYDDDDLAASRASPARDPLLDNGWSIDIEGPNSSQDTDSTISDNCPPVPPPSAMEPAVREAWMTLLTQLNSCTLLVFKWISRLLSHQRVLFEQYASFSQNKSNRLDPVAEDNSVSTGGIPALGRDLVGQSLRLTSACRHLLPLCASAIRRPGLADTAVVLLPLVMRSAVEAHQMRLSLISHIQQGLRPGDTLLPGEDQLLRRAEARHEFMSRQSGAEPDRGLIPSSRSSSSHMDDGDFVLAKPVSLLGPVIRSLLKQFCEVPMTDAGRAERIMLLLMTLSSSAAGAELLVSRSLVLSLCTHPVLRPRASEFGLPAAAAAAAAEAAAAAAARHSIPSSGAGGRHRSDGAVFGVRSHGLDDPLDEYGPQSAVAAAHAAASSVAVAIEQGAVNVGLDEDSWIPDMDSNDEFGSFGPRGDGSLPPWLFASPAAPCAPYALRGGDPTSDVENNENGHNSGGGRKGSGSSGSTHKSEGPDRMPYVRNGWHRIWCSALSLMTMLIRRLGSRPQFVQSALQFVTVYQRRLAHGLTFDLSRSVLSLARIEEAREITAMLYELERVAPTWRHQAPELSQRHALLLMSLAHTFIKLLNDRRRLSSLSMPISGAERDAPSSGGSSFGRKAEKVAAKFAGASTMAPSSSESVAQTPKSTPPDLNLASTRGTGVKLDFGFAGGGKGGGGGGGGGGGDDASLHSDSSSMGNSSSTRSTHGVMPSPMVMGQEMLRLRRNATASYAAFVGTPLQQHATQQVKELERSWQQTSRKKKSAARRHRGQHRYFFARIEYGMCLVLRNIMSFVRVHTIRGQQQGATARESLFERDMKVVVDRFGAGRSGLVGSEDVFFGGVLGSRLAAGRKPPLSILLELHTYCFGLLKWLSDASLGASTSMLEDVEFAQFVAAQWGVDSPTPFGFKSVCIFLLESAIFTLLQHTDLHLDAVLQESMASSERMWHERQRELQEADRLRAHRAAAARDPWRSSKLGRAQLEALERDLKSSYAAQAQEMPAQPALILTQPALKLITTYLEKLEPLLTRLEEHVDPVGVQAQQRLASTFVLEMTGRLREMVCDLSAIVSHHNQATGLGDVWGLGGVGTQAMGGGGGGGGGASAARAGQGFSGGYSSAPSYGGGSYSSSRNSSNGASHSSRNAYW